MSETSRSGRFLAKVIRQFTKDHLVGRMVRTGQLRKRMPEKAWRVPKVFDFEHIDMGEFTMKRLSRKEDSPKFVLPGDNAFADNGTATRKLSDYAILELHGGGYLVGVSNVYYMMAGIYNEVSDGMDVVIPDYRVAPEHPHPAALLDAVAAYQWMLDAGYEHDHIIVVGDSAGGGLALCLTMYLRDHKLPLPGGIVAMSAWSDLTASGASYTSNFYRDPLFGNTRESMIYINSYAGEYDATEPYISPLFGDFTGFPPMLMQVGDLEMLRSDTTAVAAKAKAQGVKVRCSVYEGMFHEFQMAFHKMPESRKAWAEVRQFLHEVTDLKK